MGAPYYGAYAAAAAMAGGSYISALDSGSTAFAVYIVYDSAKSPVKALLYNSNYFNETGNRTSESFLLTGLTSTVLKAKRLTAASALSRVDQGQNPSFGGQYFQNVTCSVGGIETFESTTVAGGQASFSVKASEALLVYLQ